jgi:ribonuclease HI
MTSKTPSPLVLALLTPGGPARRAVDQAREPAEPRKIVTIFVGAAVVGHGGPFRARGPAGAVALMEFGGVRKAFGEHHEGMTAHEAAASAAALGVERLRERCRIRLVTDSTLLLHTMRGDMRRLGHLGAIGRLDRALASRGHVAEWAAPETDADRGAVVACHASAAAFATGAEPDEALSGCVESSARPLAASLAAPRIHAARGDDDTPAAAGGLYRLGRGLLRGVAALTRSAGKNRAEAG